MNDWGSDEHELVRRCRDGSEAAYAELVRQHRPRLYHLAFRLAGDRETAEDVVQETFLAAFRQIDRFEPKPSLAPWLNTITVRIAKRAASRSRSRLSASLDRLIGEDDPPSSLLQPVELHPDANPQAAAEAAELQRDVAAAIEQLPFNYRAAVVLRFVMGLDYAAAAATMDVPLNTFRSHLLRGTKLLRARLAGQLEPTLVPTIDASRNGHGSAAGLTQGVGLGSATSPATSLATSPGTSLATSLATTPGTSPGTAQGAGPSQRQTPGQATATGVEGRRTPVGIARPTGGTGGAVEP